MWQKPRVQTIGTKRRPGEVLNVAVVGIGGFGGKHHAVLQNLEQKGKLRVVATCDPRAGELGERCECLGFKDRGVAVYTEFDELLTRHGADLDLMTVASPISFHAGHHRACVEAGIACYLEKPPTLDPAELEQMIDLDQRAEKSTQVGFNYIGQDWRRRLKERIVAGEFGAVRSVTFTGLWRRGDAYYSRNNWAGRLSLGETILLDSCCGNAMAHFLHNMLFYAGKSGLLSWAAPERVEAELYRANPIEGTDTVFARGQLAGGVQFRLAATHACAVDLRHAERIECEDATIALSSAGEMQLDWRNGRSDRLHTAPPTTLLEENIEGYAQFVAGGKSRPDTLLSDCRPFVHLNALLYIAGRSIATVPKPHARHVLPDESAAAYWEINGIGDIIDRFGETGEFPTQQGLPWARAGGAAAPERIGELRKVIAGMTDAA